MKLAVLILFSIITASSVPENIESDFNRAILSDDHEAVESLIQEYPTLVSEPAFLDACRLQLEKVLHILCENLQNNLACSIGTLFAVLIKERNDPLVHSTLLRIAAHWRDPGQDGQFPLITAAEIAGPILVSELLKIPNILGSINIQDAEGNTALLYAANIKTIRVLLANGADYTIKNLKLETCLHSTVSLMQPLTRYVERHKREHWPSNAEFIEHYSELKGFVRLLKALVLHGLDPHDRTDYNMSVYDMVMLEFHDEISEALKMRIQVESEVETIEAELLLGPLISYLAWLPHPDLSGLLISYLRRPLENLIAFNLRSL